MNLVALEELMAERVPSVDPSKYPDEEFELLSIPAFDAGEAEYVLGSEIGSSKKAVNPSDVLLARIVPHIRRAWVVPDVSDRRQIASGEWIVFRSERFYPPYLRHVLISDPFHAEFMQTVAGVGGSLLRARPEGVKKIRIPLPPLEEQKRIAGILDQADALRRLRARALEKLNTLGQAVFQEMFGDQDENLKGWKIGKISDLIQEANYGTSGKANTDGRGLPILRMGNITYNGAIDLSDLKHIELADKAINKYTTKRGDLLFNRTNSKDLVGKSAVVKFDEPLAIAGYLIRVRANSSGNTDYISAYLNSRHGKATLRGMCKNIVGMANINAKEMQNIKISLPPKALQDEFSNKIDELNKPRQKLEQALAETQSLFASLQSAAFQGRL